MLNSPLLSIGSINPSAVAEFPSSGLRSWTLSRTSRRRRDVSGVLREALNREFSVTSKLSHHNLDNGKVFGRFATLSAKQDLWLLPGGKGCFSEPLSTVASVVLLIPSTSSACESVSSCFTDVLGSVSADRLQKLEAVQVIVNLLEPKAGEFGLLETEKIYEA